MINMTNIQKSYVMGDNIVHALRGIDLKVNNGEYLAIVGSSGSGKSTLMNIIGCLDVADKGTYFLDNQSIEDYSEDELSTIRNRKIGFIFQQFHLLPKLTAKENIELPLIYQGVNKTERTERCLRVLEHVGLSDRMKHKPFELSGGQQQRVAIARALVTNPTLLLADEPTGNLDSQTGKDIMSILTSLHKEGCGIVLITHDDNVANKAPRRVRLLDGSIISEEGVA